MFTNQVFEAVLGSLASFFTIQVFEAVLGSLASFFTVVGGCYTVFRVAREKVHAREQLHQNPRPAGVPVATPAASVISPSAVAPSPANATSFPYPRLAPPPAAAPSSQPPPEVMPSSTPPTEFMPSGVPPTISLFPPPPSSPNMPSYASTSNVTPTPAARYPLAAPAPGQPDSPPPLMLYPQAKNSLPGMSQPVAQRGGWRPPYPTMTIGASIGLVFQILAAITSSSSPAVGSVCFGIGIVVSFVVWLMALYQAVRLREWAWLTGLLIGAVLIVFLSLGVLLFSLFGPPDSSTAWASAYAQKRLDQERLAQRM